MDGISLDRDSAESATKKSTISSGGKPEGRKEFLRRFVSTDAFGEKLTNWFEDHNTSLVFDVPFELIDLQKFDYALEGVQFQQLFRMPSDISASSTTAEAAAYLALEDFLHTSVTGLWEAFWGRERDQMPFYVSSLSDENLKFYQAEKEIAKGRFRGFCASVLMVKNPRHSQGRWDDIVFLALLRPDVESITLIQDNSKPPFSIISDALFFVLRVLIARSVSRSNIHSSSNSIFVLLADSHHGSVIKVEGDVNNLDFEMHSVYDSAAEWFKNHSRIAISPVDTIWNNLGNANWGDIGALQVLYSTFHSMMQYAGMPMYSVEDLAADHSTRLQTRRTERELVETRINDTGLSRFQHRMASPEIVEVQEESIEVYSQRSVKLEIGNVLLLEDSGKQYEYRIDEIRNDGEISFYVASSVEDPGKSLFLYVGSRPSEVEPAWQEMKQWYQVQRQTKVLNIMKQKDLSSRYLPQIVASGRVVHPGKCSSTGGNCDHHPWCGTPVLLTSPIGKTVTEMVRAGEFGENEAIKCCHDCLSALAASSSAGIRHGDIRPENVICVESDTMQPLSYVVIGWGHAVLEDRDRPPLNLHFSSTSALEEGKLCPASDAESLVYMLYFSCGGDLPILDSVEGALEWRETAWSRRLIQQKLGDISAVLKAFSDYVDTLCGTPYPVNYEIWLRRLRRHIHGEDGTSC